MRRHAAVRSAFLSVLLGLAACSPSPDAPLMSGGPGPVTPPSPDVDSGEARAMNLVIAAWCCSRLATTAISRRAMVSS